MIRYSCQSCGKSLRANDDIVGCKAQCTRCGAISKVPTSSTRPSRKQSDHIKAVAIPHKTSDSDSILGSTEKEEAGPVESIQIPVAGPVEELESPRASTESSAEQLIHVPQPASANYEFEPVFKRTPSKKHLGPPFLLAVAAAVLVLFSSGYYWSLSLMRSNQQEQKTVFEQTAEAIGYKTALFELKKSQRVMIVMGNGYLAAKELPESELGDLHEFVHALEQVTRDNLAIEEANDLFDAGDVAAAKKLIEEETKIIAEFQTEVLNRTEEFQIKTYQAQ